MHQTDAKPRAKSNKVLKYIVWGIKGENPNLES